MSYEVHATIAVSPSLRRYVAPVGDDELLQALKTGPLHPFADFREIDDLPRTGAGLYTIWDESGHSERDGGLSSSNPALLL